MADRVVVLELSICSCARHTCASCADMIAFAGLCACRAEPSIAVRFKAPLVNPLMPAALTYVLMSMQLTKLARGTGQRAFYGVYTEHIYILSNNGIKSSKQLAAWTVGGR